MKMTRLVRIELCKLRTTRLGYGLLAFACGLTGLFAAISASGSGVGKTIAPLYTYSGLATIVTGGVWGLIFAALLGVTISGGEFRHKTATLTYLAAPGRTRVLGAKIVAGLAGGAVSGLAGYVMAAGAGPAFAAGHGYPIAIGAVTLFRFGIGHVAGGALLGAIGVAVGSLIRSQLAAIIGVFAWSVIIESLLGGLFTSIRAYLPYTDATTLAGTALGDASFGPGRGTSGGTPLPFTAATALLAGVVAVGAILAARDGPP